MVSKCQGRPQAQACFFAFSYERESKLSSADCFVLGGADEGYTAKHTDLFIYLFIYYLEFSVVNIQCNMHFWNTGTFEMTRTYRSQT